MLCTNVHSQVTRILDISLIIRHTHVCTRAFSVQKLWLNVNIVDPPLSIEDLRPYNSDGLNKEQSLLRCGSTRQLRLIRLVGGYVYTFKSVSPADVLILFTMQYFIRLWLPFDFSCAINHP